MISRYFTGTGPEKPVIIVDRKAGALALLIAGSLFILGFVIPLHHLGHDGSTPLCVLGICAFILAAILSTVPLVSTPHVSQKGHHAGVLIPVSLYRPPRP